METAALWLLDKVLPFLRPKPFLRMVVKQEGFYNDKIKLSKREDGDYEASFHLSIRNDGRGVQKSGAYWHTYIAETKGPTVFSVAGEKNHQRGVIEGCIYSGTFFDIGIEWKFHIKKEDLSTAEVFYFFSTELGYFPKTVKMNNNTGKILFKDMGKIFYEIPS